MTASTPTSCRFAPRAYIVGMPPPPAQMITTPWSSSQRIGRSSKIRSGRGEGTTRRQCGPSGFTAQPLSAASALAVASS